MLGRGPIAAIAASPAVLVPVTKRFRARRNGSFIVTFRRVRLCDGIEAVAVGRRGSRASFQLASFGCPSPGQRRSTASKGTTL